MLSDLPMSPLLKVRSWPRFAPAITRPRKPLQARPALDRGSVENLESRTLLSGYTLNTLASFSQAGPFSPQGTLVRDSQGDVFGLVNAVGSSSNGGVYELAKGGTSPTLVASFAAAGAFAPAPAGLLIDASGNIFGVTGLGGDSTQDGTVFEIAKGANSITTLAIFNQSTSGNGPNGNIIADASGNIYGVTNSGGTNGAGTVWKFDKTSQSITALAAFARGTGIDIVPGADGIAMDGQGNLFGTTAGQSLAGDFGTVWELPGGSSTLHTLATFSGANGTVPSGPLIVDGSGNIFGETQFGGANNNGNTPAGLGTIFEIANGSGAVTILASFDGIDGSYPVGGLVVDTAGNLFGVASEGGDTNGNSQGNGDVYEIVKGTQTITPLVIFHATNGKLPKGALLLDGSGNIFGTTSAGGPSLAGTLFELTPGGGQSGGSSLTALLVAKAPLTAISGQKLKAGFSTTLTNTGSAVLTETVTATLYLSANGSIDANSISVASPVSKKLRLKTNGHIRLSATIHSIPISVPAGTYQWIEQITEPGGNVIEATSPGTVIVAIPQVDLSGTFSTLKTTVKAGKKFTEVISVANILGNIAVKNLLPIVIKISPDGGLSDATLLTTINKKISIKPGVPRSWF